ncbi:clan AA aspartic protease [Candidatus Woesearchaeota archaeon]|nr:clan AA aspartic protease [Candidatus Woesearchaeota archaeon]
MGHTWVDVLIRNPAGEQSEEAKALVDTGATVTVIPKAMADRLGIKPLTEVEVQTGGGKIKLNKSLASIQIKGKEEVTPVLISEVIDKVLIGVVLLESLGFSVDPATCTLKETTLLLY